MVVFFECETDFKVVKNLLEAYEDKKKREMRVDDVITGNVIEAIKREIQIQQLTRVGYSSKHVRCHNCLMVWLALFEKHNTHVECPNCKERIPITQNKEHK